MVRHRHDPHAVPRCPLFQLRSIRPATADSRCTLLYSSEMAMVAVASVMSFAISCSFLAFATVDLKFRHSSGLLMTALMSLRQEEADSACLGASFCCRWRQYADFHAVNLSMAAEIS